MTVYILAQANGLSLLKDKDKGSVKGAITGSAGASALLQTYCAQVLAQPKLDFSAVGQKHLDQLPPVEAHLVSAQAHAKNFLDVINPGMWRLNTGITGYANEFSAFQRSINKALGAWEAGDLKARGQALELLRVLHSDMAAQRDGATGIVKQLTAFRDNLLVDKGNFVADTTKINSLLDGDKGVLHDLQDQLDGFDLAIAGTIAGVFASGAAMFGGLILITIGMIAELPSAGASTALVVVGGALFVGGAAGAVVSGIFLGKLNEQKGAALTQKSQLTAEVKQLAGIGSSLNQLAAALDGAIPVATNLVTAWTLQMQDLENVVAAVERAEAPGLTVAATRAWVDTTAGDWEDTKAKAIDIQEKFSDLKPTSVRKLDEQSMKDVAKEAAAVAA